MTKDLLNLENDGSLKNTFQILQNISPLFFLRYLYLYVDPTTETASENTPSSQNQNLFENCSSSQSERMIVYNFYWLISPQCSSNLDIPWLVILVCL